MSSISDVIVRTNTNWSQINRVCNAADLIKSNLAQADQDKAVSGFLNESVIMLTDNETVKVTNGTIEVRELYRPTVGVLSMFETKDFDFSTYTSDYARNLSLDIIKDFYVPAEVNVLDFTKYAYQIIGEAYRDWETDRKSVV